MFWRKKPKVQPPNKLQYETAYVSEVDARAQSQDKQTASTIAFLERMRSTYVDRYTKRVEELAEFDYQFELQPCTDDGKELQFCCGWPVRLDMVTRGADGARRTMSIGGKNWNELPAETHLANLPGGTEVTIEYGNWNELYVITDLDRKTNNQVIYQWLTKYMRLDTPEVTYPAEVPHMAIPARAHYNTTVTVVDAGTATAEMVWELLCALETAGATYVALGASILQRREIIDELYAKKHAAYYDLLYNWNPMWSEPFGRELAEQTTQKIRTAKRGSGMYYSHRDYCGMGIEYDTEKSVFNFGYCYDGYGIREVSKTFATDAELIDWLAIQSNKTLSGCFAEYDFYESDSFKQGNQRITRAMLETYVTDGAV